MKRDDQEIFEDHCSEHLTMSEHLPIAQQKYQEAFDNHPIDYQKKNKALAAMNNYLLQQLKAIGWQDWRPNKEGKKPLRRAPQQGKLTEQERAAVAHKSTKEIPKGMGIKLDW